MISTLSAEDLVEESLSLKEFNLVVVFNNNFGLSFSLLCLTNTVSVFLSTDSKLKFNVKGFGGQVFEGGVEPVPQISSGIASQFAVL